MTYIESVENMTNEMRSSCMAVVKSIPKHPQSSCKSKEKTQLCNIMTTNKTQMVVLSYVAFTSIRSVVNFARRIYEWSGVIDMISETAARSILPKEK